MKRERPQLSDSTTQSVAPQSLFSTAVSMSEQGSKSPGRVSRPGLPLNREFSWQVATNLFVSFKYAWTGITYAFVTQRNFRIHGIVGAIAIGLGIFLHLSGVEMAVVTLTIGAVLAMELLNTALESVVDLTVEQKYHDLAKVAKDCAAGAVLVSAVAAIAVAGCLLLPPLVELLRSLQS